MTVCYKSAVGSALDGPRFDLRVAVPIPADDFSSRERRRTAAVFDRGAQIRFRHELPRQGAWETHIVAHSGAGGSFRVNGLNRMILAVRPTTVGFVHRLEEMMRGSRPEGDRQRGEGSEVRALSGGKWDSISRALRPTKKFSFSSTSRLRSGEVVQTSRFIGDPIAPEKVVATRSWPAGGLGGPCGTLSNLKGALDGYVGAVARGLQACRGLPERLAIGRERTGWAAGGAFLGEELRARRRVAEGTLYDTKKLDV